MLMRFYLGKESGPSLSIKNTMGKLYTAQGRYDLAQPLLLKVLKAYLPQRGEAKTDHLLIFRRQVIKKTLIGDRLRDYGRQIKVEVSPHRLRHTIATRLLNQGMPVTSIQHLLGHDRLDTTMRYSRVHNETVQRDYERAYDRLLPTSSLAEDFFGTPAHVTEPQPVTAEENCV